MKLVVSLLLLILTYNIPASASFEILNLSRGRALMTGEPTLKWRVDWEITAVRIRCERRDVDSTHPLWQASVDLDVHEYCLLRGRIPFQWWFCEPTLDHVPDAHIHKCSVQACVVIEGQTELTCPANPTVEADITCEPDGEHPDNCPADVFAQP